MLERLYAYNCTVFNFCKEHNIDKRKLYYHTKRQKDISLQSTVFPAVSTINDYNRSG